MKRKAAVLIIIVMFMVSSLLSAVSDGSPESASEDFTDYVWAVSDSIMAVMSRIVSNLSPDFEGINVHGRQAMLPDRIQYDKADMQNIVMALKPQSKGIAGYLSRLASKPKSVSGETPYTIACYQALAVRGYGRGRYVLSGEIGFSDADRAYTVSEIWTALMAGAAIGDLGTAKADIMIDGSRFGRPLRLEGTFHIGLSEKREIAISYEKGLKFDGKELEGGCVRFRFDASASGVL